MKKTTFTVISIMLLASSTAFAQSTQPTADQTDMSAQKAEQSAPLTREQVFQELVDSRNDGSLARVNKLYLHR